MPTNDSGYDLAIGPDKDGKYISVPAGEDYELPEPAEHPEGAVETDQPEPQPLLVTNQQTPPPATAATPAPPAAPAPSQPAETQPAEPEHGTDQKAE